MAARRGAEAVTQRDFTDSLEKVQLGAARKIVIPEKDRRRTAYHEAGHGLIGMVQPGAHLCAKSPLFPAAALWV